MIKTGNEYQGALARLHQNQAVVAQQIAAMEEMNLSQEQIDYAIQPTLCFYEQLREEVRAYEKFRRGDFDPITNLAHIGQFLIGLRISLNLSQNGLAARLGISQAAISKDERNEYHGITVERAQRILEAMGARISLTLDAPVLKIEKR